MSYTSKQTIIESLEWMIEKSQTVMERNQMIASADEFLRSPSRMEKFDAACMLIQVIGETAKRIDEQTSIAEDTIPCSYDSWASSTASAASTIAFQ